MEFALIGLGKMGLNLAINAKNAGHTVHGYDISQEARERARDAGITVHDDAASAINTLDEHLVWLMLPANVTVQVAQEIGTLLPKGGILINGANSYHKDDIRIAQLLPHLRILDAGISGGTTGALRGASIIVGGDREAYDNCKDLFESLSLEEGYGYVGPIGSGHYLKMVHNAIEYGMMESIAEGYDLIEASDYPYDRAQISTLLNRGTIIQGYLMGMLSHIMTDKHITDYPPIIGQSGEGMWAVHEALMHKLPTPALYAAISRRFLTQRDHTLGDRIVQALRQEFGGHDHHDTI